MKKVLFYFIGVCFIFLTAGLQSCKNDPITTDIDWELYEMAQKTNGFNWYKNSANALNKSSGSGHPNPKLRTRYNATASQFLDANGMVMAGTEFTEGSLIVKELLSSNESLDRYAILYKDSDNEYADDQGWVWGYMDADGTVAESATKKGTSCIGCHNQSGNIDYGLMNKEFP